MNTTFNLDAITRDNVKKLVPYSSARDEFKGSEGIFLDANENPFNTGYNRYPDPHQKKLKEKIADVKGVEAKNIFLGNGSDEGIDLLFRAFCEPGKSNAIILPPTYGMYEVAANINDVTVNKALLNEDFQPDINLILNKTDHNTRLIFFCSPNNPTANSFQPELIEQVLEKFNGIVVIDEAYIDFSEQKSFVASINNYPNLVVLQTFSKAWGMASLRLGMAFADEKIINILSKIKPPYNISGVTQQLALEALKNPAKTKTCIAEIIAERTRLVAELSTLKSVRHIYPSDANFILVKVDNARLVYSYLANESIVVRDRSKVELCEGCIRITIGTKDENDSLLNALKNYKQT
ncbi:MAG: Histidinol-phosphate aminotransferase [Bacteroidia bacterium]|nr:Histidinol-phosphate aminotransferase [Bacteroidia bacterium]